MLSQGSKRERTLIEMAIDTEMTLMVIGKDENMKKESVVAVDLKTIMEIKGMSLGSQDLAEVNGKKRHTGVVSLQEMKVTLQDTSLRV